MTLIEQIKQLLDNQVHTQREIAAQAGISAGALSAYLKGTYTGNVENVEVALKNWLSTREKKEKVFVAQSIAKEATRHTRKQHTEVH